MAKQFGPWATMIDVGGRPQLSTFWRRRLTMLVSASRTSPALSRRNLFWFCAAAMLMLALPTFRVAAVGAEEDKPAARSGIAVETARLGSSNKGERAVAVKALVKLGTPAAPALIKLLSDPRNEVRAAAAEALRSILAADPAGAPNYHKKAYWQSRIAQLKAGLTLDEALKLLLPASSPAERRKACQGQDWSGGTGAGLYRLDDYWVVALYLVDFDHKKLHQHAPDLSRSARQVWVAPVAAYTGVWVTWHVNGQKANEIQYRNGKYDGTFTSFYDNGSPCVRQHYKAGVCAGTDMGWCRSGNKRYEGSYKDGEQTGTWRFWKENGQVESVTEYGSGKEAKKTDR